MYLLGFLLMFLFSVFGFFSALQRVFVVIDNHNKSKGKTRVNEYKERLKYNK